MPEPSVLFDQLERRARVIRALFYSGMAATCGGAGVLIASVLLAIVSRPFSQFGFVSIGTLIVFGTIGFLLGLRLPIHLPTILLRADVALGLDAKLSTLHDIRDEPDKELFAARIAAKLPSTPPHPRNAFPIRVREVSLLGVAIALSIAAIMISTTPQRNRPPIELSTETSSIIDPEAIAAPTGETTNDATFPSVTDAKTAGDPSSSENTERLSLTDILTSIRSEPPLATSPVVDIDESSLRPRPSSDVSLDVILRQIEENLQQEGVLTLSSTDIATLEAFQESAPSELAEALGELLEAATRSEMLERISQIVEDTNLFDVSQHLTLPVAAQETSRDAQEDGNMVEVPSLPMFEASTEQQEDLVLIGTTLPSTEGAEGEYTYYLTKGVPVEPEHELRESSGVDFELSYEQIESIVSGRALPPDVLDTVKAYFDRITAGGL